MSLELSRIRSYMMSRIRGVNHLNRSWPWNPSHRFFRAPAVCTSAYLRLDVAREGLAVLLSALLSNASCWIWNVRYQCCCQPHVVNDWISFPSRSLVDELQEPSLCVRGPVASQIIQTCSNQTYSIQIQMQTLSDYDFDSYADVCEKNI